MQDVNHINSIVSSITGGLSRFMTVSNMFEDYISSTPISGSSHLQGADIPLDTLDSIEKSNVEWLDKNTHWQNINLAKYVGIPCLRNNSISRIESHGSICLAEGLGSLIIHPYMLESVCVCPVYSGWVNKIEGLIIICSDYNLSTIIFSNDSPNSHIYSAKLHKAVNYINNNLIKRNFHNTVEANRVTSSQSRSILIGQKNNYGHTIINDIEIFRFLRESNFACKLSIILGTSDFTTTFAYLRANSQAYEYYKDSIHLVQESDFVEDTLYAWEDKFVYPLASYRPHSISLNELSSIQTVNSSANVKRQCLYISLDYRDHGRYQLDKFEYLNDILGMLHQIGLNSIIVDGNTAVPKYQRDKDNNIKVTYEISSYHDDLYAFLIGKAIAEGISCSIIDGLPFTQKVQICNDHNIICAITPYGSSMMFPIYILNSSIGITGWENFKQNIDSWRWHLTRYCHAKRIIKENYISSSIYGGNGYVVNLDEIRSFLLNHQTAL